MIQWGMSKAVIKNIQEDVEKLYEEASRELRKKQSLQFSESSITESKVRVQTLKEVMEIIKKDSKKS